MENDMSGETQAPGSLGRKRVGEVGAAGAGVGADAASGRRRWPAIAGWWLLAIGIGLVLDGFVPRLVAPYAGLVRHSEFAHELKESGHFVFTIVVAGLLWILHPWRWRGGAFLCLCGMGAGLFYTAGKMLLGRTRPVVEIA